MLFEACIWFLEVLRSFTTRPRIRGKLDKCRASIGVKSSDWMSVLPSSSSRSSDVGGGPELCKSSARISSSRIAFQDGLRSKKYL